MVSAVSGQQDQAAFRSSLTLFNVGPVHPQVTPDSGVCA